VKEGRLISFEGLDGAGKTTQIQMLEKWLKEHDIQYVLTREPGGTPHGAEIRRLLLNHDLSDTLVPLAQVFLFQADRAQHFADVVLPALEDGKLVITDRCFDASIAYQGYGQGVDVELIKMLSLLAMEKRKPDLTILLSLKPREVHKRVGVQLLLFPSDGVHDPNNAREELNRLDIETRKFHERVWDGFQILAKADTKRIKRVDASQSIEWIHQRIIALIKPFLPDGSLPQSDHSSRCESDGESIETLL
jgi:dTMP kinase